MHGYVTGFRYEVGKTYKTKMHVDHIMYDGAYESAVEAGFHSFAEKPADTYGNQVVIECRIPKGSKYYVQHDDDGNVEQRASNKLKVVRIIK